MPRRPLIAGNWKMHKTVAQSSELLDQLLERVEPLPDAADIVVCPPFTALAAAAIALEGQRRIALGAQTMHWENDGAFTGEISAPMLRELGVAYVILGHSERRMYAGEVDANIALKVRAALANNIVPIVAVGETLDEHERGQAVERVTLQTMAALAGLDDSAIATCVIAYEPIWAIGTGHADTPESADAVMGAIRSCLPALRDARILYGGSMKPENAPALCARQNIDGGLVGGASLQAAAFSAIVAAAAAAKAHSPA